MGEKPTEKGRQSNTNDTRTTYPKTEKGEKIRERQICLHHDCCILLKTRKKACRRQKVGPVAKKTQKNSMNTQDEKHKTQNSDANRTEE